MITILGVQFISEKEAAARYSYSIDWFRKMRSMHLGPKYIQIMERGRILYPVDATDEWFAEKMKEKE